MRPRRPAWPLRRTSQHRVPTATARTVQGGQRGGQADDVGGRQVPKAAAADRDAVEQHHHCGRGSGGRAATGGSPRFGCCLQSWLGAVGGGAGGAGQMRASQRCGAAARSSQAAAASRRHPPEQTAMASMPTGASWRTPSCTAAWLVKRPAPQVNTAPTAAASSSPSAAPLLRAHTHTPGKGKHVNPQQQQAWGAVAAPPSAPHADAAAAGGAAARRAPQQQARQVRHARRVRAIPRQQALRRQAKRLGEVGAIPEGLRWEGGGESRGERVSGRLRRQ